MPVPRRLEIYIRVLGIPLSEATDGVLKRDGGDRCSPLTGLGVSLPAYHQQEHPFTLPGTWAMGNGQWAVGNGQWAGMTTGHCTFLGPALAIDTTQYTPLPIHTSADCLQVDISIIHTSWRGVISIASSKITSTSY